MSDKEKKILRRYVVSGKMPLQRAPDSGYFVTRFKEDAFFLDYDERSILFRTGARTEQDLSLPLYFVEEGIYKRKRLVETLGLRGADGKLAIFLQYARLPLIDPRDLEAMREEILGRAQTSRQKLMEQRDTQSLFDAARLDLCDEPIFELKLDPTTRRVTLNARMPPFTLKPPSILTKKTLRAQFLEYDDLLCSKVSLYLLTFFQIMPFLQEMDVQIWRMTDAAQTSEAAWNLNDQYELKSPASVRRFSAQFKVTAPPQTAAELKAAAKSAKKKPKLSRKENQEQKRLALTTRAPQPGDELFDGSLPNRTLFLAVRVERQGFIELERSRSSYTARKALSLFQLRYAPDEEDLVLSPVAPLEG